MSRQCDHILGESFLLLVCIYPFCLLTAIVCVFSLGFFFFFPQWTLSQIQNKYINGVTIFGIRGEYCMKRKCCPHKRGCFQHALAKFNRTIPNLLQGSLLVSRLLKKKKKDGGNKVNDGRRLMLFRSRPRRRRRHTYPDPIRIEFPRCQPVRTWNGEILTGP